MILTAMVLVLGACADDSDAGSDSIGLAGRSFVSEAATGHDLVEGTAVTLAFDETTLSTTAGCNTITGGYTLEGGTLTLTEEAASTMMACDPELMEQDQWLIGFLTGGVEVTDDGGRLTLTADDVTLELVEG
jgi:heat shock protein HslJ